MGLRATGVSGGYMCSIPNSHLQRKSQDVPTLRGHEQAPIERSFHLDCPPAKIQSFDNRFPVNFSSIEERQVFYCRNSKPSREVILPLDGIT